MKLLVGPNKDEAEVLQVERGAGPGEYRVHYADGTSCYVQADMLRQGVIEINDDGARRRIPVLNHGDGSFEVGNDLITAQVIAMDPRDAHYGAGGMDVQEGQVVVNMPGKIVSLLVAEGDTVAQGQGVIIVEAMKMENELKAGTSGVVSRILVAEGDTVESGAVLAEIDDNDA